MNVQKSITMRYARDKYNPCEVWLCKCGRVWDDFASADRCCTNNVTDTIGLDARRLSRSLKRELSTLQFMRPVYVKVCKEMVSWPSEGGLFDKAKPCPKNFDPDGQNHGIAWGERLVCYASFDKTFRNSPHVMYVTPYNANSYDDAVKDIVTVLSLALINPKHDKWRS